MQYCFNCGEKLLVLNSTFCHNCGTALQEKNEVSADQVSVENGSTDLQTTVYSKFKFFYHFLVNSFSFGSAFFTLVLSSFLGGILSDFLDKHPFYPDYTVGYLPSWIHGNMVAYTTFGLGVFIVIWVISPLISTLLKKLTYSNTVYNIYRDRIEYREGFMNENYSQIDFDKVIEVHLRKGFIQKRVNLGTVFIEIPASGKARNGINLRDLTNYEEVYTLLKKLVNEQKMRKRV